MARFALVALCVTVAFGGARAMSSLEYGMTMGNRAFDSACWFEYLKIFPTTNTKQFLKCSGMLNHVLESVKNPGPNKAYFDFDPENKEGWYGQQAPKQLKALPPAYKAACEGYLADRKADPPADESDALRDKNAKPYPYKAFAYCLMKTLRDRHGDKAIEVVKSEQTHSRKHWRDVLHDRENEFRARHGSEPLQLTKGLTDAAQAWADKEASECRSYHSKNDDEVRQWHGKGTGESLSASGGGDKGDDAAYIGADGWYQEITDYPYPDGYVVENKALFNKIGHFTQSVWKGTKYVGYGYAYNPDCKPYTRYVVARYSPAGNLFGTYPENVAAPQD